MVRDEDHWPIRPKSEDIVDPSQANRIGTPLSLHPLVIARTGLARTGLARTGLACTCRTSDQIRGFDENSRTAEFLKL